MNSVCQTEGKWKITANERLGDQKGSQGKKLLLITKSKRNVNTIGLIIYEIAK